MKKRLLFFLCLLLATGYSQAQTTETFETEQQNSTTFTDNGQVFTITTQGPGLFDIQSWYAGTGWNGTSADHRYIDNDGFAAYNTPTQFTISSANGAPFTLKSLWLFLSNNNLNMITTGTVSIIGKLGGVVKYTATANSGYNASFTVNNGFTFINMATFGGNDNAGTLIDQYTVSTGNNINYVCLDAMRWQCGPISITSSTKTDVSCWGGNDGTASVTASTGAASYDWTPGNPPGNGTAFVTGLSAGNWTCTVRSTCGSASSTVITIAQPSAPLSATWSQTNVVCYDAQTGSASVTPSGGSGNYTYLWSNGATASSIGGIAAGDYSVTIWDANSCSLTRDFTITQPAELTVATGQTNVGCRGELTGSATVTPSGGTGSYSYSWVPSGGIAPTASGLSAGIYIVTITDSNNCYITEEFIISQPSAVLTATQSQTNVLCYGASTGSAGVTPSGGVGDYTYLWSNGETGSSITGVAAGNYSVTINDANSCSLIKNFTITQPDSPLEASTSQTNILCYGADTGSASIIPSGGTGNYFYLWSNWATGSSITGLTAGNYSVTIFDANSCSLTKHFTITQPEELTATTMQTNVACRGGITGSATVTPSGGTGSYSYSWAPSGGIASTASGLSAGIYIVTITDSNNCYITKEFIISQPSTVLTATQSQTNVLCYGASTGSAEVTPSGGVGGYTYLWSNGETGSSITGVAAGNYSVTIFDSNNCLVTKNFTIAQPEELSAIAFQTNITINSMGSAGVTVSGGTAPYWYSWAPFGGNDATAEELPEGNYEVTVTDANNCIFTHTFTIEPLADCSISTIWDGDSWSNGVPVSYQYNAQIDNDYHSAFDNGLIACSLTINSGNLIVGSGDVFTIKGAVTILDDASLTFENNAHLMQSGTTNTNTGAVEIHRNSSSLYRQDYTMWSSPVVGQGLRDFSQETLYNRFYTYSPVTNHLVGMFANDQAADIIFAEGQGYLIRMPNGAPEAGYVEGSTAIIYDGTFTGTPNNGDITIAVTPAAGEVKGYNAIGNPYPSPISIPAFFAANNGNTDGTIYLWRRKNGSDTASAYCTVNAVGEYVDNGQLETENPNGFIQTGQGFIVKALTNAVNFNNNMRSATTAHDGSFFRMNDSTTGTGNATENQAHRIWLNLSKEGVQIAQMLVGYRSNATMGIDMGIDAPFINDVETGLNSVIEDKAYAIQGRSLPFDEQDIVPLQFKTPVAGNYAIAIDHIDGLFLENQNIYIKDNLLGVTHDIKASAYNFTSDSGIFNDRFEVVYLENALGTDKPEIDVNTCIIYKQERNLIINSGTAVMAYVKIFDTRGRLVYERSSINAGEIVISDLRAEEQVLIVQIKTNKGTISKKVIY